MTKEPNPKEQWNNFSAKYADVWTKGARIVMRQKEMSFISKHLSPNTVKILDVGCGSGRILEEYCKNPSSLELYGIDIAEKMVEICSIKKYERNEIKDIKVCDISAEAIPFDKKFDLISAIRVFKYNENWRDILKKLLDSCSKNGIVLFTIPNSRSINRFANFASTILCKENNYKIYRGNINEIVEACRDSGGEVIEITSFSKIPDFFYDFSKNRYYSDFILILENVLELIFGKILFGKELFIAVKSKNERDN